MVSFFFVFWKYLLFHGNGGVRLFHDVLRGEPVTDDELVWVARMAKYLSLIHI